MSGPMASGLLSRSQPKGKHFQEKRITMKKLALLLSFAFVAGVAYAQPAAQAEKAKPAEKAAPAAKTEAKAAAKTHDVEAEFVSFDAEKKTVSLKVGTETHAAPAEGKALAQVKSLKAGEKVTATCRDNAEGKHEAVTAIKAAAAAKSAEPHKN
jgi:hypothetical protein